MNSQEIGRIYESGELEQRYERLVTEMEGGKK